MRTSIALVFFLIAPNLIYVASGGTATNHELVQRTFVKDLFVHCERSIEGSRLRGDRRKSVRGTFEPDWETSSSIGFTDAHGAVMSFYRTHEEAYQRTNSEQELLGLLLLSNDNRYFVSNALTVPATFKITATIRLPKGWQMQELIHTHPRTAFSQEGFSIGDRKAVLAGLSGYFLRTPNGDVRYLDRRLAKLTRTSYGAEGESICPNSQACLVAHHR